jgi:hypothetical protein
MSDTTPAPDVTVVPTPDELAADDSTPVEPNASYLPGSFIYAAEPRSMGGDIDTAPVTVESEVGQ